jgi:pilus assembly protein CpaF
VVVAGSRGVGDPERAFHYKQHQAGNNVMLKQDLQEHVSQMLSQTLTPVAHFMADPDVQEIMINGPDDVWVERSGMMEAQPVQIAEIQIRSALEMLAAMIGKEAKENNATAIIDARMDGFRIAGALPSVSTKGSSICIRKHSTFVRTLDEYVADGAMSEEVKEFLIQAVKDRKNFIVSGGTSSGKTTLLNALISYIPHSERVLTIEDTRELKVKVPNWVPLESNEQAGITIRSLVKLALRYRPDRIIVGEVRGPEAFDLMQAMNTGHDGGFATLHANSATSALSRLETLVLTAPGIDWPIHSVREEIANTFDYVIQQVRENGKRKLKEVLEIQSYDRERGAYVTRNILE